MVVKPYYQTGLTTIYNSEALATMDYLIEQGIKFDAIICDPPYGTTACSWDNIIPFEEMWSRLKQLRKDKTPIVLFGSEPFSSHLRMSNIKEFKYDWIWEKNIGSNFVNLKYQPFKEHENISIFYQHNYYPIMQNRTESSLKRVLSSPININTKDNELYKLKNYSKSIIGDELRVPRSIQKFNVQRGLHPTQKPLELMKYLIETYTRKGDLILDFTAGSFTTCVAAEQLNRRSIGIELEEKYCRVGKDRLSSLQMRLDI